MGFLGRWLRNLTLNNWRIMDTKFGPENPREWDPGHETLRDGTLRDGKSAHELAAVLRLNRACWPNQEIIRLKVAKGHQLMADFQKARIAETEALRAGFVLHYPSLPKGFVYEVNPPKKIEVEDLEKKRQEDAGSE